MKKLVALLLAVAFLFGFGFTIAEVLLPTPSMVADPGIPPPDPPTQWPPVNDEGISITG